MPGAVTGALKEFSEGKVSGPCSCFLGFELTGMYRVCRLNLVPGLVPILQMGRQSGALPVFSKICAALARLPKLGQ
jgi:hypothetical protein